MPAIWICSAVEERLVNPAVVPFTGIAWQWGLDAKECIPAQMPQGLPLCLLTALEDSLDLSEPDFDDNHYNVQPPEQGHNNLLDLNFLDALVAQENGKGLCACVSLITGTLTSTLMAVVERFWIMHVCLPRRLQSILIMTLLTISLRFPATAGNLRYSQSTATITTSTLTNKPSLVN